ncbi:cupredoxin domain-containing protein [Bradyrhizobium sp. 25ACV]
MHNALLLDAAAMLTVTSFAAAAEIEVKMLNKDSDGGLMVFEPAPVKIEPGDTVNLVAADKEHNAASIRACCRTARLPSSARTAKT